LELKHLVAGGVAGAVANLLTTPLEVVRGRYTADRGLASLKSTVAAVLRGGLAGVFRGAVPTVAWSFCYLGISYTAMAALQPLYTRQPEGPPQGTYATDDGAEAEAWRAVNRANSRWALGCGLASGLVAQSIAYPFDALRRKMQVCPELHGHGVVSSFMSVLRQSGLRGFCRGFSAMALKYAPSFCCSYACSAALLTHLQP
ncbi:mitochondrial carrier domain-containing protein, partial [Tribonema minus]